MIPKEDREKKRLKKGLFNFLVIDVVLTIMDNMESALFKQSVCLTC